MMNEKRIELALEKQNDGDNNNAAIEQISNYTHAHLTVPESKLHPQTLKHWRLVQENERKCQYVIWKMEQVKKRYDESKDTVAAIWDGGIPDQAAQTAMQRLKEEYDKYNKVVKLSGDAVRRASKRIQEEMEQNGEELEGTPANEYLAWMSNNGKSVIIAKFVSFDGANVTLEAVNGKQQTLPADRFWEEEQKIFRQFIKVE